MAMLEQWCCSSPLFVTTLLVCIIGVYWIYMQKRKKTRRPPGPRGLPIIGHLHLLGRLPHQSLYELSRVHGPLMSLRLGSVPIVVASSPDMARQILKEHDHAFADRLPTAAGNHIFGGTKGMVFSSAVGPHWRLLRRISATELFSAKQLNRFRPVRAAEARALMGSIFADCDQTGGTAVLCCLRPKLLQAMSNLTTRMMAGKSLEELAGEDAASILQLIVQVPKLLGTFNVGDYLPFLAWLDLQGCERRSKKVADGLREAFERIIQARRLHAGAAASNDAYFLDSLLEYAASSSTPISIMENFLEFFIGGTDTTAVTMEWALAELLKNPEKMQVARQEIEQVVGRERVVEEEDMAHLPYVVACVKEAMRLHPVVPLLMPHGTSQACQMMGFQIPAKTQAYVNVWAIGRDSQLWDNPLQFLPERFLTSEHPLDVHGQHFELLPFGSGRRICPGLRSAVPTMNVFLACLLQGFEWTLSVPSQQLDMAEHFGVITSMKTPLVAFINPRLSKDLYTSQ